MTVPGATSIEKGSWSDRPTSLVDGTYWRSVFIAMADSLPAGWVADFARTVPMNIGKLRLSGTDLLEHVVLKNGKVPEDWDFETTLALERFLASQGYTDGEALQAKILNRNNQSTWIPGRMLLGLFFKSLWKIRAIGDARAVVFKLIHFVSRAMFPNQRFIVVHREECGEEIRAILLIATDKTYRTSAAANIDLAMVPQMRQAPRALGLPDFESVRVIADSRPITDVLWELPKSPPAGVPAESFGFYEFCGRIGMHQPPPGIPDRKVALAASDICCLSRKRVVVHSGCAYGAPVYMLEFRYRKSPWTFSLDNFGPIKDDIESESFLPQKQVVEYFEQLIRKFRQPLCLKFDEKSRRIEFEKAVIASGYMADTLRILMHLLGNRSEAIIKVSDIRHHEWFHGARKINHFNVHVRLRHRLECLFPALELELIGRGKLKLKKLGSVELLIIRQDDLPVPSKTVLSGDGRTTVAVRKKS